MTLRSEQQCIQSEQQLEETSFHHPEGVCAAWFSGGPHNSSEKLLSITMNACVPLDELHGWFLGGPHSVQLNPRHMLKYAAQTDIWTEYSQIWKSYSKNSRLVTPGSSLFTFRQISFIFHCLDFWPLLAPTEHRSNMHMSLFACTSTLHSVRLVRVRQNRLFLAQEWWIHFSVFF